MPTCKLCGAEAQLCRSHVYPDHLYRLLRNDANQACFYTNEGRRELRQQGIWEALFCNTCEQLLSREYEAPFTELWINQNALPERIEEDSIVLDNIDYLKFKLYHLSILYRTSICTLRHFSHVNLGPHEEVIRQMLLNQNDNDNYHIMAAALVKEDSSVVSGILTFPVRGRHQGHTFYKTLYAGCAWIIKVSSHGLRNQGEAGLQQDGTMVVTRERYETFAEIQQISELLRGQG